MIPVELAYHGQDGTKTVVQAYRNKSGDYVSWSRMTPPSTDLNPPRDEGNLCRWSHRIGELSITYAGKYSHRTGKYTPDGLTKNFDHRSDVTYKMHAVITLGDDTNEKKTSTIAYKFKTEETTTVESCVLQVIHGEIDTTNDAARTTQTFQVYFPELQISATAVDAEPILDSLTTVFSEIKPVK